jgi:DnaJ-class molecular chaperone
VDPRAGQDEIRRAYHGFAATFHPDGHALRPATELAAILRIFTRGTEAYRVLSDPASRVRYDEQRATPQGQVRLADAATGPKAPSSAVGRLEDHVRSARARPFAQQAEALAKTHDYGKAKLQLRLAMNIDPDNPALEAYLRELESRIAEAKRKPG